MTEGNADCTVAVIGAGAAGALTAARLLDAAADRRPQVVLIDPGQATARGVAYATPDGRHLLNVPAAGMSALPDQPDDFVNWLHENVDAGIKPSAFVARACYGDYLADHLAASARRSSARLVRRHDRVVAVDHTGRQVTLRFDSGETLDAHRHRMAPVTAERLAAVRDSGRLCQHTGEVVTAEDTGDAIRVLLSDGTAMTVGAVVNCTGPGWDASADPLLASLLSSGLARSGSVGLGLDTADDGRILGASGRRAPLWTLGALRRGGLWESTAMPEIRAQAADVAAAVMAQLAHPAVRRQLLDDRERSFLNAVTARVDQASSSALLAHLREYPLDASVVTSPSRPSPSAV